jgi:hypothetical protein
MLRKGLLISFTIIFWTGLFLTVIVSITHKKIPYVSLFARKILPEKWNFFYHPGDEQPAGIYALENGVWKPLSTHYLVAETYLGIVNTHRELKVYITYAIGHIPKNKWNKVTAGNFLQEVSAQPFIEFESPGKPPFKSDSILIIINKPIENAASVEACKLHIRLDKI